MRVKKILGMTAGLLIAFSTALQAQEELKVVRIASVATNVAGKTVYTGSAALVVNGPFSEELRKQGIKVEWVPAAISAVGPVINEGFASGKIDFGIYGDLPPIILNSNKPVVQLVAPWGTTANSYLVVPKGSTAKTIKDLKGKRIALHRGRPWEIAFANLLEANGLTFKDFKIVNVNPQVGAAALASGTVDGFFSLFDSYILEDRGVGKIIWSTKNAPIDWKLMGGVWARNDFVQKNSEVTQAIVTAYLRRVHWVAQEQNKETYIRDYSNKIYPESVNRREYEQDNVSWKQRWSPLYDAALKEHYRRVIDYAKVSGLTRGTADINQLLNPVFVSHSLKELKLESFWTPN
ncbi:ABC transporter substrate-binding protein [Methylobacillus gramineus]|uniref:ABC transporter substrate-binding protein n=1 Tax=Methylobacillus gramineus TaxID=755169 RepID=UPI001CFFFC39|nr:ABC transporter substrate-binding protein [Methylobacillus gramineus]MCB5184408.1 ABC transporter substrate-binding protein [Methylobacillus gramineus]